MARPYIVVPIADAQIARVMIGMLYAELKELSYPMPGPNLYVWDPRKNVAETHVAFGPCDELDGFPDDAEWCLGQSVETEMGTLTLPEESEQLETSWFWQAPIVGDP